MSANSWNVSRIVCDRCDEAFEYKSSEAGLLTKEWGQVSTQMKGGGTFAGVYNYSNDLCPKCVGSFIDWFSNKGLSKT